MAVLHHFQYPKGTIRTPPRRGYDRAAHLSIPQGYDSNRHGDVDGVHETYFQYPKGTIRTLQARRAPAARDSFQYPKGTIRTLLRPIRKKSVGVFQYPKGTIRTATPAPAGCPSQSLSIPQGYDSNKGHIGVVRRWHQLSIPQGYDSNTCPGWDPTRSGRLSIPQGYDSNLVDSINHFYPGSLSIPQGYDSNLGGYLGPCRMIFAFNTPRVRFEPR